MPSRRLSLALVLLSNFLSAFAARAQQPAATYDHGGLSVTIPYHSPHAGSGTLTAEILDPEDHILARVERPVSIAQGDSSWQQFIPSGKPIPFDDIVWQRVHYRFTSPDPRLPLVDSTEPISQILRRPIVRVLGQTEYLSGTQAAIRIIVSDATNNAPQRGTLRINLVDSTQNSTSLFNGPLNNRGTLEASVAFPAGLTGRYNLHYLAETPIGTTEYSQPIILTDKASILLTTEKPIYQPGQSIHVRALALERASHKAHASGPITFELEDSRGNKVFKHVTITDKFGIASAEFSLADEVNLGTYHLRALMGDAAAPSNTAELALNVERYVLPKFKVSVDFTESNNKPKRDYRPGDHVTGTIHANYFFGKPVDHAEVTLKASSMDVAVFEAASAAGKTDNDGAFHFDLTLPAYFAGRPLSQGAARALIEATVKDSAAHSETRGEPITISQSSLLVTAVPEGGTLVPGIENLVFLLTSYPDGTPAPTTLTIHIPGSSTKHLSTDAGGIAIIRLNPTPGLDSLNIEADDHQGSRIATAVPLETRAGTDQILLRTDRAILKTGDPIHLKILSTRASGSAFVDLVSNGQTILSRDVELENGHAELTLTATPAMAGTLDVDAYLFARDAEPVADHRLLFVQPANELKIETTTNSRIYKPGDEARISFHVTNAHGEGISAALGLQIVDEAVFALAERQPGFAKVFFYLEQEVMKPRYEIHSLSLPGAIESTGAPSEEQHDLAARALFSATEIVHPTRLNTEFGRSLPVERFAEYQQRYRQAFVEQVRDLASRLNQQPHEDIPSAFANLTLDNGAHPHDAWNTPLRITPVAGRRFGNRVYRVLSAGPDRQFGTPDDLSDYLQTRSSTVVTTPTPDSTSDLKIEHDRGPFNGRAEITGTVIDPSGAVIPNATVTLRLLSTRDTRTIHSGPQGQFILAGLLPGRYRLEVSSNAFQTFSTNFTLQPRDLATLNAMLILGNVTEAVMVNAAGGVFDAIAAPMAVPRAAPMEMEQQVVAINGAVAKLPMLSRATTTLHEPISPATHIRSYFPEALYINPEIITDAHGNATISIPVADSITTWRLAMLASTQSGALGTGTSSLKVFQDFFVDLDLPVTLTQGDRVTIPIAVYNYSGKSCRATLHLQPEDWFSLENDTPEKSLAVESGRVGSSQFTLNANRIGKFKLTLSAHVDGHDDIVVREIEVIPNGREQSIVFNGRLDSTARHDLQLPANAIPDASSLLIRLYPGPLSQVIEGMDSILRMPGGCFEQTSSSTYPNVLALDYMKRTKKLTPEVHAKAEGYIANGYQRLLTFEVPGGGFSWFGQAPANKILTAYGLMEFSDMAKVSEVDPRLIQRTGDWLARQQQPDGSWKPDTSFINEGATNRYNSNVLRITAYIAWSLANTGYQGPTVERARHFIQSYSGPKPDTYTLAIIANFAADYARDNDFTTHAMQALLQAPTDSGDQTSWTVEETGVYGTGKSAAIETTGLASQALLKWGQASETTRRALNFLSSTKQADGNWGTTQATIMALRAILLASQHSASGTHGNLQVLLDGKPVQTLSLTTENNDLLHQFVVKNIDPSKPNSVELKFAGSGGLAYQVVGRYFTPWDNQPQSDPLTIQVKYDRTHLAQNDIATATTTIHNNLSKTANMVMVDLGIPPGFDILSEDLQSLQEKTTPTGHLEKFSLTSTQAILYFNALAPGQTVTLNVRLRARYPIRARTFQSRVYEYYDPAVTATAQPTQLEITAP